MDIGLYIKSLEQLTDTLEKDIKTDWIMFGDYGCYKRIPDLKQLKRIAGNGVENYYYISPKINTGVMEWEYNHVLQLLKDGVSVSINDWGLLYKLQKVVAEDASLYLGRLLTKSINRWVWGQLHVGKEDKEAMAYFTQNNFYQEDKLAYFKNWHIKGIETTIFKEEEESLKKIKEQGYKVVGFIDHTIAAVSRACPIAREQGIKVAGQDCSSLCLQKDIYLRPAGKEQQEKYPDLNLEGTVLVKKIAPEIEWNGYDKVVFRYISEDFITLMEKVKGA